MRQGSSLVWVLDAGDGLIRDRTPATQTDGKSSIELLNLMRYDAMVLGEGDLARLGPGKIQQRIQEALFPVLSANVVLEETGKLLAKPYVIWEAEGHRAAIIGVTGVADIPGIEVRDPLRAVRETVAKVRSEADILVLLSHAGLNVNQQIAAEVKELDLIISGGGQSTTSTPVVVGNGPVVVHADSASPGHAGRRVGVGTWSFDAQGQLTAKSWESVALGPDIPDDPGMVAWVRANP